MILDLLALTYPDGPTFWEWRDKATYTNPVSARNRAIAASAQYDDLILWDRYNLPISAAIEHKPIAGPWHPCA